MMFVRRAWNGRDLVVIDGVRELASIRDVGQQRNSPCVNEQTEYHTHTFLSHSLTRNANPSNTDPTPDARYKGTPRKIS